jgi:hypothetical protein
VTSTSPTATAAANVVVAEICIVAIVVRLVADEPIPFIKTEIIGVAVLDRC